MTPQQISYRMIREAKKREDWQKDAPRVLSFYEWAHKHNEKVMSNLLDSQRSDVWGWQR